MNWKEQIFKPKWKHKDSEIRREAVAGLQEAELMEALPAICLEDEDAGVRAAAARRVNDLEVLSRGLENERDPDAAAAMQQRIRQLVSSAATDRPPLEARIGVVIATGDRQLLELVASQAPEAELRKTAVERIERQGFLGDRAINDPDPAVRRTAAAAISQLSTLKRVIEASRKTDKGLHQELQLRLHRELLTSGDPAAVREEAEGLCSSLEVFVLKRAGSGSAVPAEIAGKWSEIESSVPPDLKQRYRRIMSRLGAPAAGQDEKKPPRRHASRPGGTPAPTGEANPNGCRDAGTEAAKSPGQLAALLGQLESLASSEKPPAAKKIRSLQELWQQEWANIAEPGSGESGLNERANGLFQELELKLESGRQAREQAAAEAESLLQRLEQELEDGALHKALETRHVLSGMIKSFAGDRQWETVGRRMASFHGRIRELRDWQHWSNDKVRKQLIKEMELLPRTDLHPDAILDRIKSLQSKWKELENSEQIPGDKHYHAAPWMWRKFSAAGNKAFDTTRPYLEKRDEIRDRHLQEVKTLCNRLLGAAAEDEPDWAQLGRLLRSGRKELQRLDQLPHKARKKTAARIRSAMAKGNAVMQSHYEVAEKHKLRLVRAAAQLVHTDDMNEAIREAKRLQAEWKSAGSLWRSRENELWRAFREPLDPLFDQLKASKESARAEIQELLDVQRSLCGELEQVLESSDCDLADLQGKVQGLKNKWRDFERPDRRLQKQFQELADRYHARIAAWRREQAENTRKRWWDKSKILHDLEVALLDEPGSEVLVGKAASAWPEGDAQDEIDQALDARLAEVTQNPKVAEISKNTAARATELCIQLEFLAGLPSPKAEKDWRMKYQVDRLSKSLAGDAERLPTDQEARIAESEWLTLPVLSSRDYARFERRISKALKEIYRSNSD